MAGLEVSFGRNFKLEEMKKCVLLTAGVLILLSVVLGAFGAHALKAILSPEQLQSFETGVRYQMYSGLALLLIGFNSDQLQIKSFYWLNLIGIILFSGSIYLLALQTQLGMSLKFLGPITPLGGSLIIISWLVFIFSIYRSKMD